MYVFVYGTLKRGQRNHRLLGDSKFVGHATTANPRYSIIEGPGFPYVIPFDSGTPVVGEVFKITVATRKLLDGLEGYPRHYGRVQTTVLVDGLGPVEAWMYYRAMEFDPQHDQLCPGGRWMPEPRVTLHDAAMDVLARYAASLEAPSMGYDDGYDPLPACLSHVSVRTGHAVAELQAECQRIEADWALAAAADDGPHGRIE